ncbi:MAG: hypothetical protein SCARUB_00230 [Candidatus Scalindua rubra]|uniref:Uncharacterized protein n=1 Tax=Candidatus Scalindua rubra TaxID=1872076 RepID=A0A1E3XGA7_9BACT|nr:MAG: hypothetical protein SCARUB_00230 [Candidatus Scalindua rubra]
MSMGYEDVIENHRAILVEAGATNVSAYIDKLCSNHNNNDVFADLLFEGRSALMFLKNGFLVEMQESPDINIGFAGYQLYAEVKHFRLKEQDRIDQVNMEAFQDELIPYGDTVPSEVVAAWDQVVQVAKRKIKQYHKNAPYILVIGSSSPNCIDDSIIRTAINIITEKISNGSWPQLKKLSGILLISPEYNIGGKRNVYFYYAHTVGNPLTQTIIEKLSSIQIG